MDNGTFLFLFAIAALIVAYVVVQREYFCEKTRSIIGRLITYLDDAFHEYSMIKSSQIAQMIEEDKKGNTKEVIKIVIKL